MLKNFACGAKISENLHIFIGFGAKIAAGDFFWGKNFRYVHLRFFWKKNTGC